MRFLIFFVGLLSAASAWEVVRQDGGRVHKIEGAMVSGNAETRATPFIIIEPRRHLPQNISFRNVIFGYGDSYVCGIEREIKIIIDGALVREPNAPDEWHVFRKGFLTTHFGEVLSYESFAHKDQTDDLAARLLAAKSAIIFERKLDNCGDDGVFRFDIKR